MSVPNQIILAGFMGTGKTTVGKELAQKLGFSFVDTDTLVERIAGKKIPQIFSQHGEKAFRRFENQAMDQVLAQPQTVIALGGGALCSAKNFKRLKRAGALILLTASVKTILKRVKGTNRPLLKVPDPAQQVRRLLEKRAKYYQAVPWQIATDGKTTRQLVAEVLRQLPLEQNALRVSLGERSYPLYFQRQALKVFPELLQRHCPSDKAVLITNTTLDKPYGRAWAQHLKKSFQVRKVVLPDGEKYKNLKTIQSLYQELVQFRVDRRTPLIALGGGVLGDMVGFAAATYLRGIPFVQVPTTLLAQVDSSIGGKTGVDLPQGKNLVGAFCQPKFVMIDESFLNTLNHRQLISGMAEVIKYAAIFDAKLFQTLEKNMPKLLKNPGSAMEAIIRICCEWKGWVVEQDERETKGIRSKLNFGHTLGHAIESLTHYRKFTHGEAIAMGMVFAAERSCVRTGFSQTALERLRALIKAAGLPTELPTFKKRDYLKAITQDKKRVSDFVNFVYLKKLGQSVVLPTPLEEVLCP